MNTLLSLLIVVIGIVVILLVLALLMKKDHYVQREIVINAPLQEVYDFLKMLKNQDKFNKWAQTNAVRNWEYKGNDGTVGFVISWNGDKSVGEGAKEIINLVEGKRIETQIRFVRPMVTTADIIMETESIGDNQTKVTLINSGSLSYPMNLFIPIAEKKFPKDMDASLVTLKSILEKDN